MQPGTVATQTRRRVQRRTTFTRTSFSNVLVNVGERRRADPVVRAAESVARELHHSDPLVRASKNEVRELRRSDPQVHAPEAETRELQHGEPPNV